jgi:hypothetical protein
MTTIREIFTTGLGRLCLILGTFSPLVDVITTIYTFFQALVSLPIVITIFPWACPSI